MFLHYIGLSALSLFILISLVKYDYCNKFIIDSMNVDCEPISLPGFKTLLNQQVLQFNPMYKIGSGIDATNVGNMLEAGKIDYMPTSITYYGKEMLPDMMYLLSLMQYGKMIIYNL